MAVFITFSTRIDRDASLLNTSGSDTRPSGKEPFLAPDTPVKSRNLLREVATGIDAARKTNEADWQAQLAEWDEVRKLGAEYRKKEAERAALKAATEQAEQAWWEDRQEWIENFPFERTHHPTLTFQESKRGRDKFGYCKWDVNDPKEEEMMFALDRHTFVKDFYENPARYDRAFEKLHGILEEYGYADSPERLGNIYSTAKGYHERIPEAIKDPQGRAPGVAHTERGYLTKEEDLRIYEDGIVGHLTATRRNQLPGEDPISEEVAEEIRDRILAEIPPEDFTGSFAYNADFLKEVRPGDPLLLK